MKTAVVILVCLLVLGTIIYFWPAPAAPAPTVAAEPATREADVPATAASAPASEPAGLVIVEALYGNLPDGDKVDVTEKVAAMVENGGLKVTAGNENFGDPAGGIVKQLQVRYRIDGKSRTRTVQEGEVLTIAPPPRSADGGPMRLVVVKAEYGDLPKGSRTDVTDVVADHVRDDALSIQASNGNFGDPANGIVKELRVDYLFDNQPHTKTVQEDQTLDITNRGE